MRIHIINAGASFRGRGGTLSETYVKMATEELQVLGHTVTMTHVEDNWIAEEESRKIAESDSVLVQTPIWWMAPPWQYKRYMDEVFYNPLLSGGDGRHQESPETGYGTGGLARGKSYMLSCTWNAPRAAFENPREFFEGKGIDAVLMPVHKAFQFIGLSPLATFMANDVIKNPTHEADFARFRKHIRENYS